MGVIVYIMPKTELKFLGSAAKTPDQNRDDTKTKTARQNARDRKRTSQCVPSKLLTTEAVVNSDNVWLRQKTLRKAAKMIARDMFPKEVRSDIYSTCMEVGQSSLRSYDRTKCEGGLWPWVFLNTLSRVDARMCALMILGVAKSEISWQQELAMQCLVASHCFKESPLGDGPVFPRLASD